MSFILMLSLVCPLSSILLSSTLLVTRGMIIFARVLRVGYKPLDNRGL